MKCVMTHLYYGDPTKEFSQQLAKTLDGSGADILEIGIPYTDPVCDGEVFQRACKRALESGTNPFDVINGIKKLRAEGVQIPIYLTSYYGPIFKIGIEKFVGLINEAQVNGLIIPDLLLSEQDELRTVCDRFKISLIQFATVYSSTERLRQIVSASTDFIYCISIPGVTGDIFDQRRNLLSQLTVLKELTTQKILVGFGIQTARDARKIIRMGGDGVIIGSAIAKMYEENIEFPKKSLAKISSFVKEIKGSTIYK
ncbi:tryptophan synthase subunit alpha [Candidatus Gottesmanbacteria bacterium]|nr:tryptophan synthase subunit alpha [Candidatus Gottesmanbacteria bacterium]